MASELMAWVKTKAEIVWPLCLAQKAVDDAHAAQGDAMKRAAIKLRILREKHGVSLRELAVRLELSAAFLSDVELGRRNLARTVADRYIDELAKIAKED